VFRRAGVQLGVIRKLRHGANAVEAELDLHGMTVPVARLARSMNS
jgi:DNA-nicking Smr family endonuclease